MLIDGIAQSYLTIDGINFADNSTPGHEVGHSIVQQTTRPSALTAQEFTGPPDHENYPRWQHEALHSDATTVHEACLPGRLLDMAFQYFTAGDTGVGATFDGVKSAGLPSKSGAGASMYFRCRARFGSQILNHWNHTLNTKQIDELLKIIIEPMEKINNPLKS